MLSDGSRKTLYLVGLLYAALGAVLFCFPSWSAERFAWNVSPFVAMTIGGWCLGNAWAALLAARRWRLAMIASVLAYLALFGILETGVLFAFSDKLKTGTWLAWLYILALGVNVAAAVLWLADAVRLRPSIGLAGPRITAVGYAFGMTFIVVVGFLGLYGLLAPPGSRGLSGGIFPEVISMFSLRAFGAFYLSIALAPFVLLVCRDFEMALSHMALSWGAIIFITLAAVVFIGQFDFANRPGQYLYIGAYLIVALLTGIYMIRYGTGRPSY